MQDDILESLMTPLEILLFTAQLRLTLSHEEIEKKVFEMLDTLHLLKFKDTRIGDNLIRGVSGGERKRTSIAVELITDPKIIFLDEPTTGLDSYNAYEVVSTLKKLSKQGRIVIFTIHQPSSEIFPLLDKISILGSGYNIYFGPTSKCLGAFEYMGIPVPSKENPFLHFMEVTNLSCVDNDIILQVYPQLRSIENNQKRYEEYTKILSGKFEDKYDEYKDESKILDGFSQEMEEFFKNRKIKNGYLYEVAMLFARNNVITMRNKRDFTFKILQYVFIATLFSILFMDVINNIKLNLNNSFLGNLLEYKTGLV